MLVAQDLWHLGGFSAGDPGNRHVAVAYHDNRRGRLNESWKRRARRYNDIKLTSRAREFPGNNNKSRAREIS